MTLNLSRRLDRSIVRLLLTSLLTSFLVVITGVATAPSASALATASCGVSTDNVGFSGGTFEITPLHGKAFYLDLKKSINASYIGYRVKNTGTTTRDNLWLELTNFRSSGALVLGLANPGDALQPIGRLTAGSTKVIYILLKSNSYSTADQTHDVRIHSGYPNGTASIAGATAGAGGAQCFYTFSKMTKTASVVKTLAASANKVNSITVNTTSPVLGSTVVVTVQGQTGQGGSGTVTPDGAIMWLSAASNSSWPTRALRLESTSISVKYKKTGGTTSTFTNVLLLTSVNTGSTKFTSSTTYSASFTFRVMGGLSSNPAIKPVAQIASGTQIKHTGSYPSTQTTINLASLTSSMTSSKSVVSIGALETVSGTVYRAVNYRVVETDTAVQTTIDKIIDDPSDGVIFKAGSAKIRDSLRSTAGGTTIADPIEETTTATDRKYIFGGPFTGVASGSSFVVELTYTMLVPTNTAASYTNIAYAMIGNTIVGRSVSSVGAAGVTVDGISGAAIDPSVTSATIPKQPQIIDFSSPPNLGVGSTFTLDAVAESGLPVSYTSNTPSVCTVTDGILVILATGTCSISASQAGNDFWDPATNVTRSFSTLPGQVITFLPNETMTVGSTQIKAATSDSGLPVTLTVLTPDVCTVTGSSTPFTINAITAGTCVIAASQDGGTNNGTTYGPAMEVERTILIGAVQAILFDALVDKSVGFTNYDIFATSKTPTTAGSNTGLLVSFTIQTLDVCEATTDSKFGTGGSTISEVRINGVAGASGICVITASQDGLNEDGSQSAYAPAVEVTRTFVVGTIPTIVVTTSVATIGSGGTLSATATITVPNSSGSLTGTVTLYVDGTRSSSSAISTASINVSMSANGTNASNFTDIQAGILAPSDPNGEMVFTATFTKTSGAYSSTSTRSPVLVSVTPPEVPVATTNDVPESAVGVDTATITGSYIPKGSDPATAVIYLGLANNTVNDSTTAVASSGATGSGSGSTTIVTLASGLIAATKYFYKTSAIRNSYLAEGVVKSFTTKPGAPVIGAATPGSTSVSVAFTTITPGTGVTITYRVICTSAGGATGTATGSTTPILVTGLSANTADYSCKVSATTTTDGSGGGGFGAESGATSVFSTTSAKTDRAIEIKASTNGGVDSATSVNITYGETATLVVIDVNNDGTKSASKISGSACSISDLTVTSAGIGTCTFSGSVTEGATFAETITSTVATIVVGRKNLTVTASSHLPLTYGSNVPIVTANIVGFAFSQDQNSAAGFTMPTCSAGGYSNTSNAGTTFVSSCSGGSADNYSFTYVNGSITVIKRDQIISFTDPLDMDETETAQSLTVTVNSTLTPTVTTTTSNRCSVTSGAVTPSASGSCILVASQSGDDNHNPAPNVTKSFNIRGVNNNSGNTTRTPSPTPVVKQKPTINWSNPAAIFVGTPLSSAELNAIFSVPGTCVYTPALGTLLPEGNQQLSVTCTPTDLVNYEPVTTTVTIQVKPLRKKPTILWFNPNAITNPTPLSAIQLNARPSVPGNLSYTPNEGTILEPGTYVLTVKLVPTDPNFEELESKVTILVKSKPAQANTPGGNNNPGQGPQDPVVKEAEAPKTPAAPAKIAAIPTPNNGPVLSTGGKSAEVITVVPNQEQTGFIISAPDWSLGISSTTKFVQGGATDTNARVVIESGNSVTTSGTGFKPFSQVDVYVYSTPTWLGAVITDQFGNFTTTLPMPASLAAGDHTFQAQGLTPDDIERIAAVPITLIPSSVVTKPGSLRFDVFFAMNSTVITKAERSKITRQVKIAQTRAVTTAKFTITVIGWVQPNPNPGDIKFLSTNRAKNVANLMKKLGVKGSYSLSFPGLDKNDVPTARRASVVIKWDISK
jgi:hypothetical protein